MNRRLFVLMLAMLAGLLALAGGTPSPVQAAYPGAPGKIVFSRGGAGLHLMDSDGSNVIPLGVDCSQPVWSPDGMRIACSRQTAGSNSEIYVVDAETAQSQQLTDIPGEVLWPAWSPDGTRIAFTYCPTAGDCHLRVMNADGSDQAQLTTGDDREPAWSPDGSMIAFVSLRTGSWELYVMNADGSNVTQLTFNDRREMSPAWSPDGQTLAYLAVFDNHWEIAVRTLDGPESRLTFLGDQMEVGEVAWSPNGKTLVIELDKDLYLMSANGAGLMPLTDSPTWDRGPDWQPLRTTLEVTAYIDGRSQLVIQQGMIYWHHFDFAAPGRHFDAPGGNVPTYFNDDPWYPVWPGDPPDHNPADPIDNEVRCGDCTTLDQYEKAPILASAEQVVALNAVDARGDMAIVQQPAQDNDYTLIVEFDDNWLSGPEWYTVVLAYDRAPLTPTNDSYVTERRPTKSFGARHRLLVQNTAKDTDTYIKFNAARAGGTVVQATLRLYVINPGPDGGRLYAVSPYYEGTNELWLETGLTWRNAPRIEGLPLALLRRVNRDQWVEIDVTEAVIDGLDNQNGRVSFALHNRSRNRVSFSSKEGEHPPQLLITTR